MSKVKDTNYLAITAMLAARETKMLSAERMERMIDAPTNEEAAKILEECGYGDLSGLSAKDAGAALEAHIAALFDEVEGMVPEAQLVQLFRLKYDYHNAKVLVKAAALGMDAVLLTPGCSDPLYRRSARVSMGTVFQIPWTFTGDWPGEGMEQLNRLGFRTAAMALSDDSVSIDDRRLMAEEKLAVILGSEGDGLTETTIAQCDYTVKIPMYHGVDSLNVAAASAVAFWQLRKEK